MMELKGQHIGTPGDGAVGLGTPARRRAAREDDYEKAVKPLLRPPGRAFMDKAAGDFMQAGGRRRRLHRAGGHRHSASSI